MAEKFEVTKGYHIMLRCPHCDQQYEAEIDHNPLVSDGLVIVPIKPEIEVASESEN